jgi:Chlorophyll A-B binding protein
LYFVHTVGALVQEAYTFPWYHDAPKLFTQGHDYGAHNGSLLQVLIFTSFFEIMTLPAVIQMVKGESDREPGNFGLDLFGMMAKDPMMKQKEIKNGRYVALTLSFGSA